MKPKHDVVLETCIESGIEIGLRRAYKHTDNPSHAVLVECIMRAIDEQIDIWFEV